ncbi:hypothetical protein IT774_14250 [Salinimonas marina]|uniref:Uncharacterized protein n=1 Tax=Salinimonas marina TaxID=2785918 RepID=A0A7S9DXU6_9ALTE|nr:hypothetical protein [Salinimonas marina]QPG05260.1 hypothetical protein IT774_14250 [Salinimonas marina]
MRRWLLLLLQVGLLVLIFRLPEVQNFFHDAIEQGGEAVDAIIDWPEQQKLAELADELTPWQATLRPYQQLYINDVLESGDSVNAFHRSFCLTPDKNPYLQGAALAYFCQQLELTGLLDAH